MNQWTPIFNETSWDHGLAPTARELGSVRTLALEPICSRCTKNGTPGFYCPPCEGEQAANRADARDELVAVYYDRHSPALDQYPADVRRSIR